MQRGRRPRRNVVGPVDTVLTRWAAALLDDEPLTLFDVA
ncbi:hypothetical protein SEA_AMGINE_38 [Mycobacterium phage Amgine]|uniref:Uncharacterized protein n=1 Tax=Mycobacterium phage Amgine TaxID=2015817 RepID=A0A222ZMN0_9CAUD|nr:hypothetical protein I5G84_gp38 [Mycobacterium phage Amgine]ASR85639.1 hypothetical protein SEA_AMGINE_38 [Mycobacterium phage Amgine]